MYVHKKLISNSKNPLKGLVCLLVVVMKATLPRLFDLPATFETESPDYKRTNIYIHKTQHYIKLCPSMDIYISTVEVIAKVITQLLSLHSLMP